MAAGQRQAVRGAVIDGAGAANHGVVPRRAGGPGEAFGGAASMEGGAANHGVVPAAETGPTAGGKKKKKKRVPSGPSSWGKFTGAGRDRHGKNDGPPDFAFHGEICTAGVG